MLHHESEARFREAELRRAAEQRRLVEQARRTREVGRHRDEDGHRAGTAGVAAVVSRLRSRVHPRAAH